MLTNKQRRKHVNKQALKESMCPQGTNVGLDLVFVDPLN